MFLRFGCLLYFILLCGCDGSVRREGPQVELLRVERVDTHGNRRWVLNQEGVSVYDHISGRRLRRITLPDWTLSGPGDACAPDLVLDASGTAFVSSNVVPVLWRIDPARFDVRLMALTLKDDADKDVGFTTLFAVGDGTLLANGTTFDSLWRIDLSAKTAKRVGNAPGWRRCEALA
jgi:hypothetical protein